MTNFRDKARAVKAQGESVRGDYSPTGTPKRMYDYWLRHSISMKADAIRDGRRRENFCHYWRVVFLWSWLLFLGVKFVDFAQTKVGKTTGIVLGAVAVLSLVSAPAGILPGLLVLYLVVFGVGGIFAGALTARQTKERTRHEYTAQETLALRAGFVGGFFTAIPAWLFALAVLHHGKKVEKVVIATLAAMGVFVLGMIFWSAIVEIGLLATVLIALGALGAIVVAAGIGLFLSWLVESRREKARQNRDAFINKYIEEHDGEYPPTALFAKKPGLVKRFFSGVGDFIVLIAQVVRVNKWKICPTVEVDTAR